MSEFNDRNQTVISDFRNKRANGEMPPAFLILLTTTGAKSGKSHTTPVRVFMDGKQPYIIAWKNGAPSNPDWFQNLLVHPEVTVELGKETFQAKAVVTSGQERERLWNQAVGTEPGFGDYKSRTTREVPVILLERQLASLSCAGERSPAPST